MARLRPERGGNHLGIADAVVQLVGSLFGAEVLANATSLVIAMAGDHQHSGGADLADLATRAVDEALAREFPDALPNDIESAKESVAQLIEGVELRSLFTTAVVDQARLVEVFLTGRPAIRAALENDPALAPLFDFILRAVCDLVEQIALRSTELTPLGIQQLLRDTEAIGQLQAAILPQLQRVLDAMDIRDAVRSELAPLEPPFNNFADVSRAPAYVGRIATQVDLEQQLGRDRLSAVVGKSGVGKSELALRIGLSDGALVRWWLDGKDEGRLAIGIERLAELLGVASMGSALATLGQIVRTRAEVLAIVDGVTSPLVLRQLISLDADAGRLLITTTSEVDLGDRAHCRFDLASLDLDETKDLVRAALREPGDEESVENLAERFVGLPLGVWQATSFINETRMPISAYLELLERDPGRALTLNEASVPSSLARAWQEAFRSADGEREDGALLALCVLRILGGSAIPRQMWLLAVGSALEPNRYELADEFETRALVGRLESFGLVNEAGEYRDAHPLLLDFAWAEAPEDLRQQALQGSLEFIASSAHAAASAGADFALELIPALLRAVVQPEVAGAPRVAIDALVGTAELAQQTELSYWAPILLDLSLRLSESTDLGSRLFALTSLLMHQVHTHNNTELTERVAQLEALVAEADDTVDPSVLATLSRAHWELENVEAAVAFSEQAVRGLDVLSESMVVTRANVRFNAGRLAVALDDPAGDELIAAAIDSLNDAENAVWHEELIADALEFYRRRGRAFPTVLVESLLREMPVHPILGIPSKRTRNAQVLIAEYLQDQGDVAGAIAAIEQLEGDPDAEDDAGLFGWIERQHHLARIYIDDGQFGTGLSLLRPAVDRLSRISEPLRSDPLARGIEAAMLVNLARAVIHASPFETNGESVMTALESARRALAIDKELHGEHHAEYATDLELVGQVLAKSAAESLNAGDLVAARSIIQSARRHLQKAVAIWNAPGPSRDLGRLEGAQSLLLQIEQMIAEFGWD